MRYIPLILSCLVLAAEMAGREIETIEGMQQGNDLHPLQAALADLGAAQCGYCMPGQIMNAAALLARSPSPTDAEIDEAQQDNLCRCGAHVRIVEAIETAAAEMRKGVQS